MKYVIIGNSAASVGAVEAIRKIDKTSDLVIISDEPYHVYSRPQISYLLGKKVNCEKMEFRSQDFYTKNNVETILGVRVEKVDFASKSLKLSDDSTVSYDKLLIATGGTPFVPPIKGVKCDNVFTFTKWEDVDKIKGCLEKAGESPEVVVIGAGMIGLKAAEAFLNIDIKPTVIELADRVLSLALDENGSRLMGEHLKDLGVNVLCGNTVNEIISKNGAVNELILKDGSKIPCNLLIVAIGVVPNVSIVKDSSIRLGRGIIADESMESSVKDVFAAGDVAEAYDMLMKNKRVLPIWPNAVNQGRVAGNNMAGGDEVFKGGFGMNSIEVCGLPTISIGLATVSGDEYESFSKLDMEKKTYKKVVIHKSGKIVGASFVGDINMAGVFNRLIEEEKDVSSFKEKLIEENFGYLSFPEELRKEKLTA